MKENYPEKVVLELSGFEADHLEQLLYNRANDVFEPSFEETKRIYYRLRAMRKPETRGGKTRRGRRSNLYTHQGEG